MEESAQSLRLTRLSGKRDMSTLLSQSAFSVRGFVPAAYACMYAPGLSRICLDKSAGIQWLAHATTGSAVAWPLQFLSIG